MSRPDPMHGRCGGVVGPEDTREDLIARGFSPAAADEVIRFRDRLGVECEHGYDFCPECDPPATEPEGENDGTH